MANNYYQLQYTGNKVIQWKNFTDTSTPLSAANLQKSHQAIDDVDQAVNAAFQSVDNTKLDKILAGSMLIGVDYDDETGVMVFHHYDNSIPDITFNTNLQKLVVNFTYDPETERLLLTQADGTVVPVDLSAFISNPDLRNSSTIAWTINADGSIQGNIRNNSITDEMIEAHYLASIMSIGGQVEQAAQNADYYAKLSQSYANGTSNLPDRPTENVDNSRFYMEQSQRSAIICGSILTIAGQNASDSEAYGAGTRDGVPVDSTDPAYHNNSRYYKERAEQAIIDQMPVMTGATETTDGEKGAAPKPLAGQQNDLLTGGAQYKSLDQLGIQKQVLASTMTIGGQTVTKVEDALNALNEKPSIASYNDLSDKPQINGNILTGNKTGSQLGLQNTVLASAMTIGGQTVTEVEPALHALKDNLGSGGHTILNESGTELPQRSKLQFEGAIVSDDETNDATVVETVNPVEYEEDIYGVNLLDLKSIRTSINTITNTVNADDSVTTSGTTSGAQIVVQYSARVIPDKAVRLEQGVEYIYTIGEGIENCEISVGYTNDSGTFTEVATAPVGSGTLRFTSPVSNKPWTVQLVSTQAMTFDNVVTYPMLHKAKLKVKDYRKFNEQSIQNQLTEQTNVLGAKNLIPYPYYNPDAYTVNGITFTVNSDGSVTANGTATADTSYTLMNRGTDSGAHLIPDEEYILSGCPSGGSSSTYSIRINVTVDGAAMTVASDFGNEKKFILPSSETYYGLWIKIVAGTTVTNLTFKPMLRLASDPDNTYVPYAMTNREITEKMAVIADLVYPVGSIYMSANSTSPATLFGGTWTQLKDRFLLGAGDTYANGDTGGEATHTLTIDEMPSHGHPVGHDSSGGYKTANKPVRSFIWGVENRDLASDRNGNLKVTDTNLVMPNGSSQAHNNMPPYLTVYMWKRTA